VAEDMAVLAAKAARTRGAGAVPAGARADRLHELACSVVRHVLHDGSTSPAGAFDAVRGEVRQLLATPHPPLADRVVRSVAELSDRILHQADGESVVTAQQASHILGALDGLRPLLAGFMAPGAEGHP
jgi:hypothetical protein